MPQSKILVDTNAYLRLAKTVRPLLFVPFGDNEYCLYILPELNEELAGRKLQSKFPWVDDEEFAENRKHFPQIGKKQKKSIQQTFEYVWDHVQTELPGPSKVDTWYVAYA
ncbi:DNA-binding protein, partial [Escherichia coli]|nr:DNA-binding protein [Escherichia coli]